MYGNHFDGKPYGDSPKYIFEELKKLNRHVIIIWNSSNPKSQVKIDNVVYVRNNSLRQLFHLATSSVWVSSVRMPLFLIKKKKQIYYHTWHATLNMKRVENECPDLLSSRYIATAKHDSKMIDYFISDNDDQTASFINDFWCKKKPKILKFGCPRNDGIFINDGVLKKSLKLEDKRILLYAPTFRNNSSLDVYNINFKRLIETLNNKTGDSWIIFIRLHPRIHNLVKSIKFDETIRDASCISDINCVLNEFDCLITDYSSIIFDFVYTRKPSFIYASDINEYKEERSFHLDLFDLPFSVSQNNDELIKNILEFDYSNYEKKLNEFQSKINFYSKGDASNLCARHILNELEK
ncbi:MAG: CDP-glycerol glycerophosphotransferase family protein [Bacilli bacterium]|nr:CDP-glycerol glycerophosphotransferase family protein [Bacilli bacterium]